MARHAGAGWAGVTSWSLNGNHDIYGGELGYCDTLLRDDRFATSGRRTANRPAFFRISSSSWDFVGLDTSWDRAVFSQGQAGVLAGHQADFVGSVAGAVTTQHGAVAMRTAAWASGPSAAFHMPAASATEACPPDAHTDPVADPSAWEERECFERDGDPWSRFGFAVLELQGGEIQVRSRDDRGVMTRSGQIS